MTAIQLCEIPINGMKKYSVCSNYRVKPLHKVYGLFVTKCDLLGGVLSRFLVGGSMFVPRQLNLSEYRKSVTLNLCEFGAVLLVFYHIVKRLSLRRK